MKLERLNELKPAVKQASPYSSGMCDVMALALNRITGKPFGLWAGKFHDEDSEEGFSYEFAHACIVSDFASLAWIDSEGTHSGIPEALAFDSDVFEVVLLPATENDIREAFTCETIKECDVLEAMRFVRDNLIPRDLLFDEPERRQSSRNKF